MSIAKVQKMPRPGTRMTVREFESFNLPEGSTLMLVKGVVYDESNAEEGDLMTKRNRQHARIELLIGRLLENWIQQAGFPAKTFSGEVGCVLDEEGLSVGIDVAVFGQSVLQSTPSDSPYINGPPILAVEILSPSDQVDALESKINAYLESGVPLVWVISPKMKSITVYSAAAEPVICRHSAVVSGGQVLPGFSFVAESLFE